MRIQATFLFAFCVMALVVDSTAHAQAYPSRTVRIIVPGPPGGGTDALARLVAQKLTGVWKRQVIVENKPGASGMIGTEYVAKAAPDGHTFMVGHNGTHAINAGLREKLSYDPVADFVPITLAATFPNILVVNPSLPVHTVKDLIALAKAKPGQLTYGTSGVGFPQHLAAAMFVARTGTEMLHVPYRGSAAALVDTIAGNVVVMFPNLPVALPHVASGKLRAIGVTSRDRSPAAPDTPTIAEAGVPGYEMNTWFGFLAPAGVPDAIMRRLHSDITAALLEPDVKKVLVSQGGNVVASTGKQFGGFIKAELDNWAAIIRKSGATAN